MKNDEIYDALVKRALGYSVKEECIEYVVSEDGEKKPVRTKVMIKEVPPELAAIKLLMKERKENFDGMTEEELISERDRLLALLEKEHKKPKNSGK